MTWPFENDTGAIVKKLAKRSLASEKRRNLMVVIAVALAAFLISFAAILSVSVAQIQRNQAADTYEAVFTGVEASDVAALKDLPEFARVGEYYLLGQEHSEQGYNASYVYCDSDMIYIARSQMELIKGELPERENEVAVSEYFLSSYGSNAGIGETVRLDTESFQGNYTVTGILSNVGEKEGNTCAIAVSKAALTRWAGFDPAGYRAYVHFQNDEQLNQEIMTACCREIAARYGLPHAGMNSSYFAYASKSIDFASAGGIAALVLIGGYVVIQSIFRISIQDKIQSYGQLRTIGATSKQIRRVVKRESRRLGSIGILLGVLLGVAGGLLLFPKGFHGLYYGAAVLLTVLICWFMVTISVRRPVKIAAGISPLEAVRFSAGQERIRSRKKPIKLNPVSMGLANFRRDRKKAASIAASLSLGGILLLIVSSVVLTRSPEQAARLYFPDGDYKIYLSSEQPEEEVMAAGNPLNDGLRQEILSVDGVTDVLVTRQALHAKFGSSASTEAGMCDALTDANRPDVEAALVSGAMPADAHSVLLDASYQKHLAEMDVGAAMELSLGQKTVTVTISGLLDPLRMTNGHGALALDSVALFAPEELFRELHPEIENFDYSWSIVSDPKKAERVEAGLQEILSSRSNLGLDTIGTHIAYEKMQSGLIFGGLRAVSWLIFLFGVVNLINTTLSNQMSRRRENSILRSIGLTSRQLCRMNICEGLCYAAFAALSVLLVGLPIAVAVCREVSRQSFAGEIVPYQFPILEMGLFLLVLFGLEFLLSAWTAGRQRKRSLVEQMREMES
ncbi:ABC transporter permease [uncultured Oscillibacter sp.]|uniref:ABC transporter permease n=1 Tax=uncultured Oscillibacter sp. TaxID=876091 RepID=UPI00266F730B|nr:ABC transporter permease [uncultured Oscillibacter sp.]